MFQGLVWQETFYKFHANSPSLRMLRAKLLRPHSTANLFKTLNVAKPSRNANRQQACCLVAAFDDREPDAGAELFCSVRCKPLLKKRLVRNLSILGVCTFLRSM